MKSSHRLGRSIVRLSFALFIVALFTAPPTALAASLFIDESVEGQAPTLTNDAPNFFIAANVAPSGQPESWIITVFTQGGSPAIGPITIFELTEPGTPTRTVSDRLRISSFGPQPSDTSFFQFLLFSDDETGKINDPLIQNCATNSLCAQAVENGQFQVTFSGLSTDAGSFDVRLKSDLADVPEPSPLLLVSGGVVALWWRSRVRRP